MSASAAPFGAIWARAKAAARAIWHRLTPVLVVLGGLTVEAAALGESSRNASLLGFAWAGVLVLWGVDLAYQRGHAAATRETGLVIAGMISAERDITIVVRHERVGQALE